jgi:hypothetical protein
VNRSPVFIFTLLVCSLLPTALHAADADDSRTIVIDFAKMLGKSSPRVGFLGGLRDETPDALVDPLHPTLWRIGHQFRRRIAAGLPAAIARVQKFGATYKLVMSDLINSRPKDYAVYEADVRKLVGQTGDAATSVIWEVSNEPDTSYKPIDKYYELYAHAFKALREANPKTQICGPSFAFPSYDKYKAFLDYCKANHLECNDLSWHYTGWDPGAPQKQKWHLERMREFLADYPEQHIREIHCDEWGAGPDKPSAEHPGRLEPGRAVVWFYYLQDVYQVDRACRANWGNADDYLGGIVMTDNQPYPAYHAYRFYGAMSGKTSVTVTGNNSEIAALACRSDENARSSREVLLGSTAKGKLKVTLELRNLGIDRFKTDVALLANSDLDKPMTEAQVPHTTEFTIDRSPNSVRLTLGKVEQNQAYRLLITNDADVGR